MKGFTGRVRGRVGFNFVFFFICFDLLVVNLLDLHSIFGLGFLGSLGG